MITHSQAVIEMNQANADYERVRSVWFPNRPKINAALAKFWRAYDQMDAAWKRENMT